MKKKLKIILMFAKPHKWIFVILFMCIIVTTFSGAFYPYIFGRLVDEVFYAKNMKVFLNIILIYGAVYLFNQLMHFALNMSWARLMTRFLFDIRKAVYKKVLSYKGNMLAGMHTGDIIARMSKDTDQFMNFIHWNVFYNIGGILNLLLSLGFIIYICWPLAVMTIVLTPVSVYISRYFAKKAKVFYKEMADKNGLISSWIFEIIKGMQDIRLLCAAKNVLSDYAGKTIKVSRLKIKSNKIEVLSERVNSGISLIGQMSLYIISAVLIYNGQLTIGGFTACVSYFGKCISMFNILNKRINAIAGNMVSFDRVIKVLDEKEEDYNEARKNIEIKHGNIKFENVFFSYDEKIPVLKDISFSIKSGEKVSLAGNSGVGKSTLANLINKIYETDNGRILIDGININECNLYSLRSQIGIVHQDILLFNGTIRYNMIFSEDKSKDKEILRAFEMAHLFDYIKTLPDGLDTIIGTGGRALSGGQKQRLAVARIFMKNPKILIFDEATSSLDSEAEQVIKDSWEQLCKNRTIIIIAHRLSTIIDSDRVLVLKDGKIAGYDTHKKLLENCEEYMKLFKEQYSLQENIQNYA